VIVLVVAPHPDDEAIGCGGTVLRHVASGDTVHAVFLSSGELGLPHLDVEEARGVREGEARAAAAVLGLEDVRFLRGPDWTLGDDVEAAAASVAEVFAELRPDLVYVPHAAEWHPDHKAAHAIVHAAADRDGVDRSALLTYEVWTPLPEWDVVEDISETFERKLDAIRCYASQLSAFDYLRSATGLAQYRGALAGRCAFAEVFDRSG
jgi:LmbE family N-acetylglucosaminyl deacetylase